MKKINLKTYLVLLLCFYGTINKINAQYSAITFFTGFNGSYPGATPQVDQNLISDGTYLYGMTSGGGTSGLGVIFKVLPDGTSYTILMNFIGASNGSRPNGSFIYDGTYLYGMTSTGGTSDLGTVFKIKTDGTSYTKLKDFTGTVNGSSPKGSLVFDGTFLYGITSAGGAWGQGDIFKIKPDGTGYTNLFGFNTGVGLGLFGSLYYDGTYLFGMTRDGGLSNKGTIFKILTDGTGYTNLLDFGGLLNGSNPEGSLISDGTFLYGMTKNGGASDMGVAFKILPNGLGYVKLLDFDGTTKGRNPNGSLIFDGTLLYGMTRSGGSMNYGSVFQLTPNGTYTKLFDFTGAAGCFPTGSLLLNGSFLYGMTTSGGPIGAANGTIFRFQLGATSINKKNKDELSITIYPNPTDGILNLKFEIVNEAPITIKITNALGQVVLTESASIQHSSINIQHFEAGIYFININDSKGNNAVRKIIKN